MGPSSPHFVVSPGVEGNAESNHAMRVPVPRMAALMLPLPPFGTVFLMTFLAEQSSKWHEMSLRWAVRQPAWQCCEGTVHMAFCSGVFIMPSHILRRAPFTTRTCPESFYWADFGIGPVAPKAARRCPQPLELLVGFIFVSPEAPLKAIQDFFCVDFVCKLCIALPQRPSGSSRVLSTRNGRMSFTNLQLFSRPPPPH